ncbi:hypothetical protein ACHAXT_005350 [Thalassiosira profunda]
MSRLTAERARTALYLLILTNVLVFAYRDELRPHLRHHRRSFYRIIDGNIRSMLLSIFYHADPTHLFFNMMALYRYGTEVFVHSSSKRWHSTLLVLSSYVACGIGAFWGVELLSRYHEFQWEQRVDEARYANRCTHWLCKSVNDKMGRDVSSYFTNAWADLSTSFDYADVNLARWYYLVVQRIGASGVVYGWMGMRLVTSWFSPHHSRLDGMDYFFLIATLAHDLNESPLSLDDLRLSVLLEGDGVDHTAHIMGAAFGMVWALIFILWEKMPSLAFGRWRWGRGQRTRL